MLCLQWSSYSSLAHLVVVYLWSILCCIVNQIRSQTKKAETSEKEEMEQSTSEVTPEPKRCNQRQGIPEPKTKKTLEELQDAKTVAEMKIAFWSQQLQKVNNEIQRRQTEENNAKEAIINDLIISFWKITSKSVLNVISQD